MRTFIEIRNIVQRHMRRVKDIKRSEIAVNLYMLCTRRKPSVLLDFCKFDNSGLDQACLQALGPGAVILKLDLDYFIFYKSVMVEHLRNILLHTPPVYIDISSSNPAPILCSSSVVGAITSSVEQVLRNLEENEDNYLYLENLECWNLSTLFGVLLGFPVVYWYTQEQDGNCLSQQPLSVYSVLSRGFTPISFSVPVSAVSIPSVPRSIDSWLSRLWPELPENLWNQERTLNGDIRELNLDGEIFKFSATSVTHPVIIL
jgi:hypothetical protein